MSGGPVWLIGAGNMGGAILRGWIAQGMNLSRVTVIDPFVTIVPDGVTLLAALPEGGAPDTVVLAVKPQQLKDIGAIYARQAKPPRVLLSILAGVETASLAEAFGAAHVIRTMPNLPASIGQGVTVLYTASGDPDVRAEADALMAPLGLVEWIADEALFDAVTALSGSGPGFVFRFIEAMAEAGAALGLPADQAVRLARATVAGSAMLAIGSDETPAMLADRVASPGGTTREGLNVLDAEQALKTLLAETLAAAARRNADLAALARG